MLALVLLLQTQKDGWLERNSVGRNEARETVMYVFED
jgi:hypothetical protein